MQAVTLAGSGYILVGSWRLECPCVVCDCCVRYMLILVQAEQGIISFFEIFVEFERLVRCEGWRSAFVQIEHIFLE